MTRRGFLAATPLVLAAQTTARPPNVVVILADDLGYGDLSCYGAPDIRTPNIDALARDGMRFTRFYANSPVCSPTRAALLTGCNPDTVGVPGVIRTHPENSWGYLSPSAVLLPQLLKTRGHHSGLVGKWHLGLESPNTPTERGFDSFHGFLGDMMDDYLTIVAMGTITCAGTVRRSIRRAMRRIFFPIGRSTISGNVAISRSFSISHTMRLTCRCNPRPSGCRA